MLTWMMKLVWKLSIKIAGAGSRRSMAANGRLCMVRFKVNMMLFVSSSGLLTCRKWSAFLFIVVAEQLRSHDNVCHGLVKLEEMRERDLFCALLPS